MKIWMFLTLLALHLGSSMSLAAQGPRHSHDTGSTTDISLFLINGTIHGLVAGIRAELKGADFSDAFVTGYAGGVVTYGGRRLVGTSVPAKHWAARWVSALGLSITDNAGRAQPWNARFWLPIGPAGVQFDSQAEDQWSVLLSLYDVIRITEFAIEDDYTFDFGKSLQLGMVMFWGRAGFPVNSRGSNGTATGSAMVVERMRYPDQVIDHEAVHVLQHDAEAKLAFDPLEAWLVRQAWPGFNQGFFRFRPGLLRDGFHRGFNAVGLRDGYVSQLEREAYFIETR